MENFNQNIKEGEYTFEKVWLLFQETDRKMQETNKQMRENNALMAARSAETERKIDKLGKLYGGVSDGLGYVAEDYFFNAVNSTLTIDNVKYNYIIRNEKRTVGKVEQEYDILLINDNKILVIEVKHNFHHKDVDKFVKKILPKFEILHPEFKNYTVFGAIAGMTMHLDSKEKAKEYGLYVLTQDQDGKNIQLLNEKGFVPQQY